MKNRIKDIREEKHITQEVLAEKIGVARSFISRVETGTKPISLDLASEIADFLEVSLDELAGRERKIDTMPENKKVYYLCDPKKNKECNKTICQDLCYCTEQKEYAVLDENGEPIIKYVRDFSKRTLQQIL